MYAPVLVIDCFRIKSNTESMTEIRDIPSDIGYRFHYNFGRKLAPFNVAYPRTSYLTQNACGIRVNKCYVERSAHSNHVNKVQERNYQVNIYVNFGRNREQCWLYKIFEKLP